MSKIIFYLKKKRQDIYKIHNSNNCGCKSNTSQSEQIQQIQKSIDIYKACSKLYIISHKKLQHFGSLSKLDCRMEKKNKRDRKT